MALRLFTRLFPVLLRSSWPKTTVVALHLIHHNPEFGAQPEANTAAPRVHLSLKKIYVGVVGAPKT